MTSKWLVSGLFVTVTCLAGAAQGAEPVTLPTPAACPAVVQVAGAAEAAELGVPAPLFLDEFGLCGCHDRCRLTPSGVPVHWCECSGCQSMLSCQSCCDVAPAETNCGSGDPEIPVSY